MAGKVLNIEIDDRLTKVCQSTRRGKSTHILKCFMFQTPDNVVSDGVISDPDAMAEALRGQLRQYGLTDKEVVFTLTSGKVASREVMLPPAKDNKLKSIVDANAADYFPVDLTRYHVTYSLLERVSTGANPGCRVQVLAVPLSVLEGYFKVASLCGLSVGAIDYFGNSQYQALRGAAGGGVRMYVNVDCNHSLVTFMNGSQFLMQRSFAFGGDELVLNCMNARGMAPDTYMDALRTCSSDELIGAGGLSQETVDECLSRLVGGVTRSLDFFNSNHWDMQVEGVVLMGACGHLYGLRDMVAAGTDVPTSYLDDSPSLPALSNAAQSISEYISCIGSNVAPLDLMPPSLKEEKKKSKDKSAANVSLTGSFIGLAVCVLAAAALSWFGYQHYQTALAEKQAVEDEIASLSYTRDVYNSYVSYQDSANALVAFEGAIDSPNDQLTAFIAELEQKMPSDILVLSASCGRNDIVMNVTVSSYDNASVVLTELRAFDSLSDVQISSLSQETDESGGTYVAFSLSCTYGANPYLTGANPYYTEETTEAAPVAPETDTAAETVEP